MDTYLMRATCLYLYIQKRELIKWLSDLIASVGRTSLPLLRDRHLHAMDWMAAYGQIDHLACFCHPTINQSHIIFFDCPSSKLLCKMLMRLFVLGYHEQTRCITVESMH